MWKKNCEKRTKAGMGVKKTWSLEFFNRVGLWRARDEEDEDHDTENTNIGFCPFF